MKTRRIVLAVIAFCLLLPPVAFAQGTFYTVKGTLKDAKGQPVPFANVLLLHKADGSAACGGTSGQDGVFSIKCAPGQYVLNMSFMGYKTVTKDISLAGNTDIGVVVLEESQEMLSDVVITAKLTERKADRMVINLAGSPLVAGKNTKDVLKYAPGVWVDSKGSISINGNSNVRVMINDRDVRMNGQELVDYLETLKAEDIVKIEVIPTAGAEYEADSAGGVVHITLKKQALEGMNGSVGVSYSQNKYWGWSPSANLNYKKDKWSFTGRYSHNDRGSFMDTDEETEFFSSDTKQVSGFDMKGRSKSHYGDLGIVYDITERSEAGVEVEYYNNHSNMSSVNNTDMTTAGTLSSVKGAMDNAENTGNFYATAFYKIKTDTLGSSFKAIADYADRKGGSYLFSDAFYYDANGDVTGRNNYTQDLPSNTKVYTVRADFDKKTSTATSYSFGAKYANSSINSDSYYRINDNGQWRDDDSRSNRYRYHEEVWAGYGKMNTKLWGNQITIGLRVEGTSLSSYSLTMEREDRQSYVDFFPSVSLMRQFGKEKAHSIALNYSRRISRPYYGIFNPYEIPLSEFSAVVGNPDIRPSYINRYSVTGVFFQKYSVTAEYGHYTGLISQIVMQSPENPDMTVYKHVNMDSKDRFGLSISAPVKVTKWWGLNAGLYGQYYIQDNMGVRDYQTNMSVSAQNSFTFGKGWSADFSGYYNTGGVEGNMHVDGMLYLNAGVVKRALDNRLTFSLNVYNITGQKFDMYAYGDNYRKHTVNREGGGTQNLSFSVRWNFKSGKNVKVKKVESGSQEERDRL